MQGMAKSNPTEKKIDTKIKAALKHASVTEEEM